MQIVADTATTAEKHEATAGIRSTADAGTRSSAACCFGISIQVNAPAARRAIAPTATNGSRIPPIS